MARRDALLRLHKTLVERRKDLLRKLSDDLADLGGRSTGDTADVAFDAGSDEMASQLAELEARELKQIERALAKLENGTYGQCEGCSCKIPTGRLNILPYAAVCVNCQREMEEDPNWDSSDSAANWEKIYDAPRSFDDQRELRLSDIEMDISGGR